MTNTLDDYINQYIQEAAESDKKVALHLKEIVPGTTHLDERIFYEIIKEFKEKMDKGKDFKTAFRQVCEMYFLNGDTIKAELPGILTRIILNKKKFISFIKQESDIPYSEKELEIILTREENEYLVVDLLKNVNLSKNKVVFATFDERKENEDLFSNHKVIDIINMLALDRDTFEEGEIYSAVKVRYRNSERFENRYPTFIDAGWWDRFYPSAKDDDFGRTKSLDPALPDMPEVVHENVKISQVLEDIDFLEDKNGVNEKTSHR
jgi:hypothetical protein